MQAYGNISEIVVAACAVVAVLQAIMFLATRNAVMRANQDLISEIRAWVAAEFARREVIDAKLAGLPCQQCPAPPHYPPIYYPPSAHPREGHLRGMDLGDVLSEGGVE